MITIEHEKSDGILLALGDLSPGTVISELMLASMLGKHIETIRRWRRKNHLPPSIRLGQERVWTVKCILDHISSRLEKSAKERELRRKHIISLSPVKD